VRRPIGRVALAIAAAAIAGPAPGIADAQTVRATSKKVTQIGTWRLGSSPKYRAAIRQFGRRYVERAGGDACNVLWPGRGLRIIFANFGANDACDPGDGFAQKVRIYGGAARRHGWHTWNGVKIGSRLRRLRRRHPDAYRRGHSWWIRTGYVPLGCPYPGCPVPRLKAVVKRKRVKAFVMWVGAAGD
jgi:hypothetical protein